MLLDVLELLGRATSNLIKIFVTSRYDEMFRKTLAKYPTLSTRAQDIARDKDIARDIKHYVARAVHDRIAGQQLLDGQASTELKNHIVPVLENQSNGLYVVISFSLNIRILGLTSLLWTRFQIDTMCREHNEHDVKAALRDHTGKAKDIYSYMLTAIEMQNPRMLPTGKQC